MNISSTVSTKNVLDEIANVIVDLSKDLLMLEEYTVKVPTSKKYCSSEIRVMQSIDRMLQEMNDLVRILRALARQVGTDSGHEKALLEAVLSLEKMKAKLIGTGDSDGNRENLSSSIFF